MICPELSSGKEEMRRQGTCAPRAWPRECDQKVGRGPFSDPERLPSEFPGTEVEA